MDGIYRYLCPPRAMRAVATISPAAPWHSLEPWNYPLAITAIIHFHAFDTILSVLYRQVIGKFNVSALNTRIPNNDDKNANYL